MHDLCTSSCDSHSTGNAVMQNAVIPDDQSSWGQDRYGFGSVQRAK